MGKMIPKECLRISKLAWRLEAGRFPSGGAQADACASLRTDNADA